MATSEAGRFQVDRVEHRIVTFALVDHGLTGSSGHNLTYCRRVLSAAAARGLRVVAGVGCTGGGYDAHAPSLALFAHDVWKNNPTENRQWNAVAVLRALVRRMAHRPGVGDGPAPDRANPDLARPASASGLRSGLSAAAQGLRQDIDVLLAERGNADRFHRDLAGFLSQASLEPGDVVYLPTVLAAELRGLERLLDHSQLAGGLRWRLMLRYAPHAGPVRRGIARSCRRLAARRDADVRFFSDTEQLCRMYQALCGAPFGLLPIPVDLAVAPVERRSSELVIGYFGDARDEKGFDLLPSVIRHVRNGALASHRVRFVVQTNLNTPEGDPRTRAARLELIELVGGDLELIEGPLAPEAYQDLLRTVNIVILPYEPGAYAERSSGVLMEALMAGAPCVVTSGGWMATMIEAADTESPAGMVVAANARAIAEGVLHIAADWAAYARGAQALREQLRPRFDPAELVRLVAEEL